MNKLIIANWKMNPASEAEAKRIISALVKKARYFGTAQLVVCPSFTFLNEVARVIMPTKTMRLGAQNIFIGKGVAHTGEIGTDILKEIGVEYVLIGHSERRADGESNETIREKIKGALSSGFTAVLCVGERERDAHGKYYDFVKDELISALTKLPKPLLKKLIIAYEPVWAIGKSEKEAMKPEDLHEMTIFIKRVLSDMFGVNNVEKIAILYGGSVTKINAKEIIEKGNVQGLLVGRASLEKDFAELIEEVGK